MTTKQSDINSASERNVRDVIAELRELLKNPMNQWGQEEMARYDALVNWPSDFVPQLLEYVEELERKENDLLLCIRQEREEFQRKLHEIYKGTNAGKLKRIDGFYSSDKDTCYSLKVVNYHSGLDGIFISVELPPPPEEAACQKK